MSFVTRLALSRRPVTILTIILLFALGVYQYNGFQRELFPAIEFPNIFIVAVYPNSDPETVAKEVSEPIENAIAGMTGLNQLESTSNANFAVVIATFDFGTDMKEAQRDIESAVNAVNFPDDVDTPSVNRINNDTFPVMNLSVSNGGGADGVISLSRIVEDVLVPAIERVDGVGDVREQGLAWRQVVVTADADKMEELGLSPQALADAISQSNVSFPAGTVGTRGISYPVRTTGEFGSVQDVRDLVVGFEQSAGGAPGPAPGARPIRLSDAASVELKSDAWPISRTNGNSSITLEIVKDPDANTVDVTEGVHAVVADLRQSGSLPSELEVAVLNDSGPQVRESLDNLLREGTLGFLFAVAVVFVFLLNVRPSLLRGITLSLRPTAIIAVSIPLSILVGVLMMSFTDISLNFMSLAGLAIAVGRVVDDSIVVLENTYRHIQQGEERVHAAYEATREVSAAIVSSTLTTVAIFVPLAFIQGLVGEFFSPFAISVSLALIASTAVAITAVPALGAILLRRGDFPETDGGASSPADRDTILQRIYTPLLIWTLRHKFITIIVAIAVTGASLVLLRFIPITFFPGGAPEFITINIELPTGTGLQRTNEKALLVEEALDGLLRQGYVETYQVTLGSNQQSDEGSTASGAHLAGFLVTLPDEPADDIEALTRAAIPDLGADVTLVVSAEAGGPPEGGLEMTITGPDFNDIAAVSRALEARLSNIEGIANLTNSVSDGQDEVVIRVDAQRAGEYGLTVAQVSAQVNQFVVGRDISEMNVAGDTLDIILRGDPDDVDDIDNLKNLKISGPIGVAKLGFIADIAIEKAPIVINRYNQERSATIDGTITAEDTGAVGAEVARARMSVDLPPGVEIKTGGIFQQIAEGFQDVYVAMAAGIVLVYLVMVATLGSLRTPFVIVLSLPLAISGALLLLLITGRTLSLSALMGFLLLIGIVVTNAIVLLTFVEQLRQRGYDVYEALVEGGRVRLRPILMTAFTTTFALVPLAASSYDGGIIGAELATVVIGGLISSTFLTLVVVPVVYMIMTVSIPGLFAGIIGAFGGGRPAAPPPQTQTDA